MATDKTAPKVYRSGTHRSALPADTIGKIRPHMARMGITRVANVTGLDRLGVPVVMVTRPNARSVAVSQGKGLDLESARASALMESVETWHAEHIDLPVVYGTYASLCQTKPMTDPWKLPQVQDSNYDETTRVLWIKGTCLIEKQDVWLPFEMVHTDYTVPLPPGHGCFHCSTNGLASGNHVLEAQCHAICEVIERDATTLLHHLTVTDRDNRRLDNDSVDDNECHKILARFKDEGLNMAVWDATTDTGVPAFYGLLINHDNSSPQHIGAGAGCHPNKAIALSRTLTEAAQTRLTYISGARDDLLTKEYDDEGLQAKHHAAASFIGNGKPTRLYSDISQFNSTSVDDDRDWLIGRLKSVGIDQVICVDLTKPEIGINVVRVVIPGLEAPHDDDDFMPGPRVGRVI